VTKTFTIPSSSRQQVLDITEEVQSVVEGSGISSGVCLVSVPHATCALYLNENEDGLTHDVLTLMNGMTARDSWYHDRLDQNAAAHLGAILLGNSVTIPLEGGNLVLGTWQRIMLTELDGPRHRRVNVTITGQ
jgi:secondary thiamine-phosphate synthase enzyme